MSSLNEFKRAINNGHDEDTIFFKNGTADNYSYDNFLKGRSPQAAELFRQAKLVAKTDFSVILSGESGTGKESIAKYIHWASERRDKPFVAIDCGTLTKELAASEFFGHLKGSFTGAIESKVGQFEMAHEGTIFLDEISNLPYDIQISLLRVIQERKIRRVGSLKEINIDVRIIAASNVSLEKLIKKNKFREDLYHRINEFSLDLPPLREREEDIELFANYFLTLTSLQLDKKLLGFQQKVLNAFKECHWPGNLREMKNVIKRATLLTEDIQITLKDIPEYVIESKKTNGPTSKDLKSVAENAERKRIIEVLKKVRKNKSKAARILDIDRKTLYNKIKALDINVDEL